MKKYASSFLQLILLLFLISCGNEKKKDTSSSTEAVKSAHQWTDKDMLEFERNCVGFLESEDVRNAKTYCDCLLKSSIEAYPDPDKAMELEQNDIVQLFVKSECLDDFLLIKIENPWTEEVEQIFIEHCKTAQKRQNVLETDATKYCSCALEEIKQIVPNPHHVMTLTDEELSHILERCK